jgi:hypothetical protein
MSLAEATTQRPPFPPFTHETAIQNPDAPPPVPKPEVMQRLFEVAARYQYWLGSPADNAAIGINLG